MKDKFKKLNGKAVLSIISIVFVVFLILFTSFWDAGIDLTRWRDKTFISNLLLNTSICMFGLMASLGFGDNYFRTLQGGLFQTAIQKFAGIREKISNFIDYFSNWNKHLHEREQKEKYIRYLKEQFGISQAELIIEHLDINEVAELEKPFLKVVNNKEIYYKALTQKQIEAIVFVMQGKLKIKYIHESYFLSAYTKNYKNSMYEQASNERFLKGRKSFVLISAQIFSSISMALIFAGFVIDCTMGADIGSIMINIITRLCILSGALYNGYNISSKLVKFDVEFINYKSQVLEMFYLEVVAHQTVDAMTEEEEAKQEYERLKENEESIIN